MRCAYCAPRLHQSNSHNPDACGLAFRHSRSGTSHFIRSFSPSSDPCATRRRFWDLDQSHSKMERNPLSKWHYRLARKYYREGPFHRGYYGGQCDIEWPNVANAYHNSLCLIFPKRSLRLARARQSQQEPRRKSFSSFPPGWAAPLKVKVCRYNSKFTRTGVACKDERHVCD